MKNLSKKTIGIITTMIMMLTAYMPSTQIIAAGKSFTFKGSMTKEVLRNYASRAVTSWIVLENNTPDPIFEEDLRMHLRIGAKYIGRAASFSWGGNMTKVQVDDHFRQAKEIAKKIHAADPEMILQAGVFEIIYKATVNSTEIPAWVFEAFGQPVETRNFRYEDVAFPSSHEYGPGFWGTGLDGAIPKIANLEAQMYFYYNICRYIDAGFEAVHIGQAEKMMEYRNVTNAREWERVLTLARQYATKNARRGVVLFDAHSGIDSGGLKVGNRLLLDIQGAALVPNETRKQDGAMMCEVTHFQDNWLSWIGRTSGGTHPMGFEVEQNFTILEFDNYGGNNKPGVPTMQAFYNWGYDDVTWFAVQPEWYRNQFLLETDEFLRTDPRIQDKDGKQIYFLQPVLRRVLTADQKITYIPGSHYSPDFVLDFFEEERTLFKFQESPLKFELTIKKDYRANRQSDGCPSGSNQEDTIRKIFLGEGAPEDPDLIKVILPEEYRTDPSSQTSSAVSSSKVSSTSSSRSGSQPVSSTEQSSLTESSETISAVSSSDPTSTESLSDDSYDNSNDNSSDEISEVSVNTSSQDDHSDKNKNRWWIFASAAAVLIIIVTTAIVFFRRKSSLVK